MPVTYSPEKAGLGAGWADSTGAALVRPDGDKVYVGDKLVPYGKRMPSGLTRTKYPAFSDYNLWHAPVLDFSTAGAHGDALVYSGTVTPSVDATTTWQGKPTQRLIIAGTTHGIFQTGTNTASVTLGATAQTIEGVGTGWVIALKCPTLGVFPNTATRFFISDSSFANYKRYNALEQVLTSDGWRIWTVNSNESGAVDDINGTPTLTGSKRIRVTFSTATTIENGTYYVGGISVVPPRKPCVVLTFDDGYDEVYSYLAQALRARGLPASFSIDGGYVNTGGYMTATQLAELAADPLFELTNHGMNNVNYTGANLSTYLANIDACDAILTSVGASAAGKKLHAFIQGSHDATLITAMIARGFTSMREVGGMNRYCRPILARYNGQHTVTSAHNRYTLAAGANLESGLSVATTQTYIQTAMGAGGMFMVMGHKFEAAAGVGTWVAGYDTTHGMSNLLDWIAQERDAGRLDVVRWSDWAAGLDAGY
jgi:peptidoglycan/xylan/chitin deacetylase (PgdA/CDA1 family)